MNATLELMNLAGKRKKEEEYRLMAGMSNEYENWDRIHNEIWVQWLKEGAKAE